MDFGTFYVAFDSAIQKKFKEYYVTNCLWPKWAAIRVVFTHDNMAGLDRFDDTDVMRVYAHDGSNFEKLKDSAPPIASLSVATCRKLIRNPVVAKTLVNPMNAPRYQLKIEKLLADV
jgi:hypothetical protein